MAKLIQELEAENLVLREKLQRFENKYYSLLEGINFYSELGRRWDKGKKAREALTNSKSPKYKPINSMVAQIFREGGFESFIIGDDFDYDD